MDEDLKIVLTAELEADEQASARRISAQLPNIAKLINSMSSVKVGVTLDESNVQAQTQRLNKRLDRAAKTHDVGVTLNLDQSSVNKIKTELDSLHVSPDITRAMTNQLDQMGIQIDRITGRWVAAADEEERMLNLTIQGTDEMQRTVTYLQTYDTKTGEISAHLTNVTSNLKQQRQEQERLSNQQKAVADSNSAYFQKWGAAIKEISASYLTLDLGQEQIDKLNQEMARVVNSMSGMTAEGEKFSKTQIANVEIAIKEFKAMTDEAIKSANQQKAADESRLAYITKTQIALDKLKASYKGESSSKPLIDGGHIGEVEEKIRNISNVLDNLKSSVGAVGTEQKNTVEKSLAELDALISKYRNLEYVATTLRTKTAKDINTEQGKKLTEYENSLKSAGIMTEEFQADINTLRENLKTAFDRSSLTDYLNSFDKLKSSVSAFQQQVRSMDSVIDKMISLDNEITSAQAKMIKMDSDDNRIPGLQRELNLLNQQKAALQAQLAPYADIVQYSSKVNAYNENILLNNSKIAQAYGEVSNRERSVATEAHKCDVVMQGIESTVIALEAKFSQIIAPTDNLVQNMGKLHELESSYSTDMSDRQKIQAYKQLQEVINSCTKEMNDLAKAQQVLNSSVSKDFSRLIDIEKQITSLQSKIGNLDPKIDKGQYDPLNERLTLLNQEKAALDAQLAPYKNILQYAREVADLENRRLLNANQLVISEAELAKKAKDYDASWQRIPSTIDALEAKFNQIISPTENLIQNMQLVRDMAAQYTEDMGDSEKVRTYEELQKAIRACKDEMSDLLSSQRNDVNDFKFTQGLEKAKADLETIGRTWSALKKNEGLNAQFRKLSISLREINNQADLNKWRSEFSRFKAEVKAAGKNTQSFVDILKNNISKVWQWALSTASIYGVFNKLGSAADVVVELDTAMVDLRKTTNETEVAYRSFYNSATETAKELGVTTREVISQTAEWSRLGLVN